MAPSRGHNRTERRHHRLPKHTRLGLVQLPSSSGGSAKAAVPVPGPHFVQAVSEVLQGLRRIGQGFLRPLVLVHLEIDGGIHVRFATVGPPYTRAMSRRRGSGNGVGNASCENITRSIRARSSQNKLLLIPSRNVFVQQWYSGSTKLVMWEGVNPPLRAGELGWATGGYRYIMSFLHIGCRERLSPKSPPKEAPLPNGEKCPADILLYVTESSATPPPPPTTTHLC